MSPVLLTAAIALVYGVLPAETARRSHRQETFSGLCWEIDFVMQLIRLCGEPMIPRGKRSVQDGDSQFSVPGKKNENELLNDSSTRMNNRND